MGGVEYPTATVAQVEFFRERGWLVVADAVDATDLEEAEPAGNRRAREFIRIDPAGRIERLD